MNIFKDDLFHKKQNNRHKKNLWVIKLLIGLFIANIKYLIKIIRPSCKNYLNELHNEFCLEYLAKIQKVLSVTFSVIIY